MKEAWCLGGQHAERADGTLIKHYARAGKSISTSHGDSQEFKG